MTGPSELKWIAVDLDGTIAEQVWPETGIGAPIERNLRKLDELDAFGWTIVVHTSRGWEHHKAIEDWLMDQGVQYSHVVCGKLLAHRYVDDRNVDVNAESWLP